MCSLLKPERNMTVFSFITMARTLGNKPGFHHLLTRFTISRRPAQTLAYEESGTPPTHNPTAPPLLSSKAFWGPPETGDLSLAPSSPVSPTHLVGDWCLWI
ncbi:hypothetical protein L3X38_040732 [Prunus dulcis]|uniref:Uncharacterized protein n=1 Tax=Prunus dulcis TaxID=3755 RepID=A0AAD4YGB8_PRUDU|nr:hypothetical protein L3X38_040732 [Prunus dulcis]